MKNYHIQNNVGKSKYIINYHNGEKFHKDNSPFFDIKIFSAKNKLKEFEKELEKQGYNYQIPNSSLEYFNL